MKKAEKEIEVTYNIVKEVFKNFINDLQEKYPDKNISHDFIQGCLVGYELGLQKKETSKNDDSC